ncbi:centlein-like [Lytechinus variegatus]|uniref:centlein-like n=1 Tax=Lytechinus variegatus TaxID=7654 RepID=UPI001BB126D8|nr:centlein-like [Lytechinus variegatus]
MLENKILGLTETLDKKKVEIDSLRKRVAVITKEKHHFEQQAVDLQSELDKKAKVLRDTLSKLSEAESALTEMETTASQQLQMLASQSETALDAAHVKFKQLQSRVRELEAFIEDLATEFSSQAQAALDQALAKSSRTPTPGPEPEKDQSMIRAQSIASSILNMSTKDLEQFMEEEKEREAIQPIKLPSHDQDSEWHQQIKSLLNSKKFQRKKLKDMLMEKLHSRDEALALARGSR